MSRIIIDKVIIFLATFFVSVFCVEDLSGPKHGKAVVCLLNYVEEYEEPSFKAKMSSCTHIAIQIGLFDRKNGYIVKFPELTTQEDKTIKDTRMYLLGLKQQYPHIKILMGVDTSFDDINEGVDQGLKPRALPQNVTDINNFLESSVRNTRDLGFDGLNLLIGYLPTKRYNIDKLQHIIEKLKLMFIDLNYMLTVTFINNHELVSYTEDLVNLHRYVDLLIIATYYNGTYPIIHLKNKIEFDESSVEFIIKHLLAYGVRRSKLVLAWYLIEIDYFLTDIEVEEIHAEDITVFDSFKPYSYKNICLTMDEKPSIYHWSEEFSLPYTREEAVIKFFENPKSLVAKIKLAIEYGIKGVGHLDVQYDDTEELCNSPNDTYSQFIDRYNKIKEEPNLLQRLKDINLPNVDTEGNLDGKSYGVLHNKLYFREPELKPGPCPLLRTVNQAISLALEEKAILDTLTLNKEPERYCLFWPKCASPLQAPEPELTTNASSPDVAWQTRLLIITLYCLILACGLTR